jgi:hypothetical protein
VIEQRLKQIRQIKQEFAIYNLLVSNRFGLKRNQVEELKEEFATRKPEPGEAYYYYSGPLDDKTRPFCKMMLKIDKVFSQEEIDKISEELNYDVLEFKGAYNCRHKWIRFRGKIISTPKPTMREIRKLIIDGIVVE